MTMDRITAAYGQPVCAILYAVFAFLAAKVTWIPLASLALLHLVEYAVIGFRVAKQNGYGIIPGFLNCLCFGFTWWLPIKNRGNNNEKD